MFIVGFAQNVFTREVFSAPCYIPWTVLKLELQVCMIHYMHINASFTLEIVWGDS